MLFVDDDALVLRSIRRMLHDRRGEWDMCFFEDPVAALKALENERFDAVISDMQMPEVDGAELLTRVMEQQPRAVRVVLSAYAEDAAVVRSLPVAHQFLAKPCDPERLVETVERAWELRARIEHPEIVKAVGSVGTLPTRPEIYNAVCAAIADPLASLHDIAHVIVQDVAMSAKLLQLVNSAFIGLPRPTSSVVEAASYIGTNMIKHLVLSVEAFEVLGKPPSWFKIGREHQHAFAAASIARRLLSDRAASEEAFAGAVVHDIGRFVLAGHAPALLTTAVEWSSAHSVPLFQAEKELWGFTHGEVGAYLLAAWGLPITIVEAVAHHHEPERIEGKGFGVAGAVYVGNVLADQLGRAAPHSLVEVDPDFAELHGIHLQMDEWSRMAQDLLGVEAS